MPQHFDGPKGLILLHRDSQQDREPVGSSWKMIQLFCFVLFRLHGTGGYDPRILLVRPGGPSLIRGSERSGITGLNPDFRLKTVKGTFHLLRSSYSPFYPITIYSKRGALECFDEKCVKVPEKETSLPKTDLQVCKDMTPTEGLEPSTTRLRVWRSTDWARRASRKFGQKGTDQWGSKLLLGLCVFSWIDLLGRLNASHCFPAE